MNEKSDIAALEAENKRLRAEVEASREKLRGMDDTIKASLYLLEDVNEAKTQVERAEKSLADESGLTKHLLMIAEATAHTTSIDKLMEQTIHCTREITECDIVLSYLWDSAERVFKPSHEFGLPHNLTALFRTESLKEDSVEEMLLSGNSAVSASRAADFLDTRDVILSGKPLLLSDDAATRAIHSSFPWLRDANISAIGVIPLKGRREALGLLIGMFSKFVEIREGLRKVMEGISNQVSVALEEARLYRESIDKTIELSHKIETIQAMHEIDKSILSTLNRDEILQIAARMVAKVIACDRATVALVDRQRGGFVYSAGFGLGILPLGNLVLFNETSTTEVIETMRPQYERDLREQREILSFERKLLEDGFFSHIRVPLIVKEEAVGVLNVGSKRPSAFTTEDLSTLERLSSQISVALENSRLISNLEELFIGTVKSLSSTIDAKSKWTAGHSERVTTYALGIGKEMGLPENELKDLELAGLLHDIGKIGTYEAVLDKAGKLTPEEFEIVKKHPVRGAEVLEPIKQMKDIIPGVLHHHERYDGTGYPDGLKAEKIPLMARILAVADTFDAMKADRPYRTGRTMEFIIEEFKRCSGTQFDPKIIDAFLKLMGK